MSARKKIYKYLLEIITIFIGITLSFTFEEFRQNRNERNNRDEIIKSLIVDIDFKKREMKEDMDALEWQYKTIDSCLMFAQRRVKVPDRLIADLYSLLSADYVHFEPTTPSYFSLTSTGIWQQLPDSLRRKIYDSYNHNFLLLNKMYLKGAEYSTYVQEKYLVADGLMQPLEESSDYDRTNIALGKPEFRSALLLFRNNNYSTIDRLKIAYKELDRLSVSMTAFKE